MINLSMTNLFESRTKLLVYIHEIYCRPMNISSVIYFCNYKFT